MTPDEIVDAVRALDPLADLPRTGWVLRGVAGAESIAAHTFGVAYVAMLLTDALRAEGATIDGEKVLRMALVHDAPEAATGDVPMPVKSPELDRVLKSAEGELARSLLPEGYARLWDEAEAKVSIEARIVKAADKIQMMIKLLTYTEQGRGSLDEFWENPANLRDGDIPLARAIYEAIYRRAGKPLPK